MEKKDIVKALKVAGVDFDPKSTKAELEKLLPKGSVLTDPEKVIKKSNQIVSRKVSAEELIPLQKEGRLVGYDPKTKIGQVKDRGSKINWPEVSPDAV